MPVSEGTRHLVVFYGTSPSLRGYLSESFQFTCRGSKLAIRARSSLLPTDACAVAFSGQTVCSFSSSLGFRHLRSGSARLGVKAGSLEASIIPPDL
jgi:hypothetical protein